MSNIRNREEVQKMSDNLRAVSLAYGSKAIDAEIKTRALLDLLIEKEIITMEEFREKYNYIEGRDFDKLKAELAKSIIEYAKTEETDGYNESFGEHKNDPNKSWY
jgi:hypothetical protein